MTSDEDLDEAAALLRGLLDLLPDGGGQDTALRHRVQGVAIALDAIVAGDDTSSDPPS